MHPLRCRSSSWCLARGPLGQRCRRRARYIVGWAKKLLRFYLLGSPFAVEPETFFLG